MSAKSLMSWAVQASRTMATSTAEGPGRKVAILGAAGGIGQPLSLLLKVWHVFACIKLSGDLC